MTNSCFVFRSCFVIVDGGNQPSGWLPSAIKQKKSLTGLFFFWMLFVQLRSQTLSPPPHTNFVDS